MVDYKTCSTCKKAKPKTIQFFHRRKKANDNKLQASCIDCRKILRKEDSKNPKKREKNRLKNREWRANNRERVRANRKRQYHRLKGKYTKTIKNQNLKYYYGITLQEFEQLRDRQDNKCAICFKDFHKGKKGPHVDHCHKSKKIRGLLCNKCNLGIGHFEDKLELIQSAGVYLAKYD